MINVEQTIISQFANSPVICQLIDNMNDYIDPATNFDDFLEFVWNVDTANGYGLDIWGRIVAMPRTLTITAPIVAFGFETSDSAWQPWGQAPFYSGAGTTSSYYLAEDLYRKLILTKALANISICAIPSLNNILRNFFADRGKCYVVDSGHMAMVYYFEFDLEPFELSAVTTSGAFPHPAGVAVSIYQP